MKLLYSIFSVHFFKYDVLRFYEAFQLLPDESSKNDYSATLLENIYWPLKPTGYVLHHQFGIQQQYALPTLYLCVLYLSENKQRIVPLTA
jgi:hypothetical protein